MKTSFFSISFIMPQRPPSSSFAGLPFCVAVHASAGVRQPASLPSPAVTSFTAFVPLFFSVSAKPLPSAFFETVATRPQLDMGLLGPSLSVVGVGAAGSAVGATVAIVVGVGFAGATATSEAGGGGFAHPTKTTRAQERRFTLFILRLCSLDAPRG